MKEYPKIRTVFKRDPALVELQDRSSRRIITKIKHKDFAA